MQWNAVWSEAGVLRGVHVHVRHDDYLTVPVGRASVGLRDLRRGSPTEGLTALVELGREQPGALVIPHGVAHGFYFHEPSLHVYAVSEYWDPADELACNWADPELGIEWPVGFGSRLGSGSRGPAARGAARPASALAAALSPGTRTQAAAQPPGERVLDRLQLPEPLGREPLGRLAPGRSSTASSRSRLDERFVERGPVAQDVVEQALRQPPSTTARLAPALELGEPLLASSSPRAGRWGSGAPSAASRSPRASPAARAGAARDRGRCRSPPASAASRRAAAGRAPSCGR